MENWLAALNLLQNTGLGKSKLCTARMLTGVRRARRSWLLSEAREESAARSGPLRILSGAGVWEKKTLE